MTHARPVVHLVNEASLENWRAQGRPPFGDGGLKERCTVDRRPLIWVSAAAAAWSLWYAIYRGYYAAGGSGFLPGTIRQGSEGQFQLINLTGAVIIGMAAVLPPATLPLWSRRRPRQVVVALCWLVAVGCCMHALVDSLERVLSLTGILHLDYWSGWATINHRAADLQDLLFNEPWFLVEGLAFGALGWIALGPGPLRRRLVTSAVAVIAALTLLGMLTVFGVSGKMIVF
jgi:hypothetical protein